jgi:hypothetical protein
LLPIDGQSSRKRTHWESYILRGEFVALTLWYKLAEANGLSGQAGLSEGQSLRIPAGVMKNTYNASTFQPYDPADTIGDTSPTKPHPPKVNICGGFGQFVRKSGA